MGALLSVGAYPVEYDLICEGSRVVLMWSGRGVMLNGDPYHQSYCWVVEIADDRIVKVKAYLDTALVEALFNQGQQVSELGGGMEDEVVEWPTREGHAAGEAVRFVGREAQRLGVEGDRHGEAGVQLHEVQLVGAAARGLQHRAPRQLCAGAAVQVGALLSRVDGGRPEDGHQTSELASASGGTAASRWPLTTSTRTAWPNTRGSVWLRSARSRLPVGRTTV